MTPAARLIAAHNPSEDIVAAMKSEVAAELGKHERDGTISLEGSVFYVSATR